MTDRMYEIGTEAKKLIADSPKVWRSFVDFALTYAQKQRADAGYGGEMGDRGASHIEDVVEAYLAGQAGRMPRALRLVEREYEKATNPDYATYLELKAKFEGTD